MLIQEAPSKRRAVFSGYGVHIGGFFLTWCNIGVSRRADEQVRSVRGPRRVAPAIATLFEIRFRKACRPDLDWPATELWASGDQMSSVL